MGIFKGNQFRTRNIFASRAEAIKYRDKKLREEEEYAWYPYTR